MVWCCLQIHATREVEFVRTLRHRPHHLLRSVKAAAAAAAFKGALCGSEWASRSLRRLTSSVCSVVLVWCCLDEIALTRLWNCLYLASSEHSNHSLTQRVGLDGVVSDSGLHELFTMFLIWPFEIAQSYATIFNMSVTKRPLIKSIRERYLKIVNETYLPPFSVLLYLYG